MKATNGPVELKAGQSILERGVRARVPAPLFLRLLGVKTLPVTVRRLYAGTLLDAGRHYLRTGITDDQLKEVSVEKSLELMDKHGREISRAVACAVLNNSLLIRMFTGLLANYLLRNMPWREICALLEFILIYNGSADFMNTTRLVRSMKITDPTNPGQKTKKGS